MRRPLGSRSGCTILLAAALILPRGGEAQEPPPVSSTEAKFNGLVKAWRIQVDQLTGAERQRELLGGDPDPEFLPKLQALNDPLDAGIATLLKEARETDPPAALRIYLMWAHLAGVSDYSMDTNSAITGQIESAKPTEEAAFEWGIDTTAARCQASDAATRASKIYNAIIFAQAGNISLPNARQRLAECAKKAVLIVDLDSHIQGANYPPFATFDSHVRIRRIELRFNASTGRFESRGATIEYSSFAFTPDAIALPCDTAWGQSGGTLRAAALMRLDYGETPLFTLQLQPGPHEIAADVEVKVTMGHDGMRPQGCGHRKEHQVFAYAAGHTLTGLGAPFDLRLDDISKREGASVPIQRSPATFTGTDIVTITQVAGAIH